MFYATCKRMQPNRWKLNQYFTLSLSLSLLTLLNWEYTFSLYQVKCFHMIHMERVNIREDGRRVVTKMVTSDEMRCRFCTKVTRKARLTVLRVFSRVSMMACFTSQVKLAFASRCRLNREIQCKVLFLSSTVASSERLLFTQQTQVTPTRIPRNIRCLNCTRITRLHPQIDKSKSNQLWAKSHTYCRIKRL